MSAVRKDEHKTGNNDRTEATSDDTHRMGPESETSELPARYSVSVVIRSGPKKGAEYRITSNRTVFGRGTGSDIILDDPAVSRMHAAIEYRSKAFLVRDLESKNGTLLDGKSIKKAALNHGDRFQIGDTVIEFVLAEKRGGSVYVIE